MFVIIMNIWFQFSSQYSCSITLSAMPFMDFVDQLSKEMINILQTSSY